MEEGGAHKECSSQGPTHFMDKTLDEATTCDATNDQAGAADDRFGEDLDRSERNTAQSNDTDTVRCDSVLVEIREKLQSVTKDGFGDVRADGRGFQCEVLSPLRPAPSSDADGRPYSNPLVDLTLSPALTVSIPGQWCRFLESG